MSCSRDNRKVRVAAYARVSTEKEDQLNSLETQRAFFTEYINEHPDWQPAGVFADAADIIGLTRNPTSKGADLVLFFCKN